VRKDLDPMEEMDLMVEEEEVSIDAKEIPPEEPAKTMSVHTMAQMLGLKKTGSYWLVNKGFFKTVRVNDKTRVDIESFEYWYAGQIKYRKVNGDPPGERLRKESYDVHDISKMLGLSETTVYELMQRDKVPYILVDYWRRWPKKAFDCWYENQTKYRNREEKAEHDREIAEEIAKSMTIPEAAWLLGISRKTVYGFMSEKRVKGHLEYIIVDGRKRILKENFLQWYKGQKKYAMRFNSIEEAQADRMQRKKAWCHEPGYDEMVFAPETAEEVPEEMNCEPVRKQFPAKVSHNTEYYTADEAAVILGRTPEYVKRKIKAGLIPGKRVARSYRISREEFDTWMSQHLREGSADKAEIMEEDNGSDR